MKNTAYLPTPPARLLLASLRATPTAAAKKWLLGELRFAYPQIYQVYTEQN